MQWEYNPGCAIQAPLSYCGPYVISHRAGLHILCYRPTGHHLHIGKYPTPFAAYDAASSHLASPPRNPPHTYPKANPC